MQFWLRLTEDAWSSMVYKGFMVVTGHYVDKDWEMKSLIIELDRFYNFHTGKAAEDFMEDVIETWNLTERIQSLTTDIASDFIRGISMLHR